LAKSWITALCAVSALAVCAPQARAQELYTFTVSALAGIGGSVDADPGDGLEDTVFQLGASMVTEPRTRVAVRAGELGLGGGDDFGPLTDAGLTYLNIAGEYHFYDSYYSPWVYLGLGGYRLEGDRRADGATVDDTALGLAVGLVGEFNLTRRLDVLVELTGHWADFDDAQVFATGQAGLAFHF
jgi:hypothetical protein